MPRIRSIKPDFFTSEDVAALPLRARLTWVGLWTYADDHGVAKDNPLLLKAAVWPLDEYVTEEDVAEDLALLAELGRIVRWEVDGKAWLAVTGWHVHQAINRPSKSRNPVPPVSLRDPAGCAHCARSEDSVSAHAALTPGGEGKGKEGKGGERARTRPARKCPEHINDPSSPPCGPCKDARIAHDTWSPPPPPPPRCTDHDQELPCQHEDHKGTPMPEELRRQVQQFGKGRRRTA